MTLPVMLLLAGCAPSVRMLRSEAEAGFDRPVQRMSILSTGQVPDTWTAEAQRFAMGFRDMAARCGIAAQVAVETRPGTLLRVPADGVEPLQDTYLVVSRPRTIVATTTQYGQIISRRQIGSIFNARLQDVATGREVWRGEFNAVYRDVSNPETSQRLAELIPNLVFNRMAQDGVLRQCAGRLPPTA